MAMPKNLKVEAFYCARYVPTFHRNLLLVTHPKMRQ
jgi:hypothetical protein